MYIVSFFCRNELCLTMSNDIMKSLIILIQNNYGDADILLRILNNLKNEKPLFPPDKEYLDNILKKYFPNEKF